MCIVAIVGIFDVAETQDIQLLLPSTSSGIDREKNGPRDQATNETNGGGDLEEAQEEERIQRVVIEYIAVGKFVEYADPVEETFWQFWRALPIGKSVSAVAARLFSGGIAYCGRREPRKLLGA